MLKNKVNYKLLNFLLLTGIVFLMYQTGKLWTGVASKIFSIVGPFLFAFAFAYALYPFLHYLESKKIPKGIAVFIVIGLVLGLLAITLGLIVPLLFDQLSSLFNSIIAFLKELSLDYDLNIGPLQADLSEAFNDIIKGLSKYISDGAMNFIGVSMNAISMIVIGFSAAIYFLIDMGKIRDGVKRFLRLRSKKTYRYVQLLDHEMTNYFNGFFKIVLITLFEYTIAFYIIGHPNALLLGFLAAVATLIPYFGGIITNCIASITAFVISPALFIRTLIAFFVLSNLDGYVINPFVYGKTNSVHPIIVILSVFAGGILAGVVGIIISLPVAILIISTLKYYKEDIVDKWEDIKDNKEEKAS